MTAAICHTADVAYEPSDELRAAAEAMVRARDAAKKLVDGATERLHKAIADEVAKPTLPADVARFMKWHPNYVRRIARAGGVAPMVAVEPPRRRPAKPAGDDQR